MIKKIEKDSVENMTQLLETNEDHLVKRLQTLSPMDLDNNLNHSDEYSLLEIPPPKTYG